ncbi:hypothetical protein ABIC60_002667 [Phyllobacterium ifriqiyense]
MDNWLKALIATACVVIIVGGGYYAYTQYGDYSSRTEQAKRLSDVEKSLYERVGAKVGEPDKVRNVCASFARDPAKDSEPVKDVLSKCRTFGYL